MEMENKLFGKTIIWNGDSICQGSRHTGNWATRIAEKNSMTYKNYAVGGGTIAEDLPPMSDGRLRHSVSATLDLMYEEYPNADYIIIEGGTNDADLLGLALTSKEGTRLGSFDPSDYSGDYDRTTFCGALESVFYRLTKYYAGKKIGFIVAQKMGFHKASDNRRLYFDEAVKICIKWGIPYLDLWNTCYLNPRFEWFYNKSNTPFENRDNNTGFYQDGQHLTANGYDLTADIIDSWLKTL